ncbi:hypothetical protein CAOG_02382 [Capsaspora owczarzaki ATCC 30864]|uniref:Uncharacterized protein n=1 Tax=Capsaspora owczarzaki (strain ATCC 30864) TaxID=595528 RepID=A0A0D2WM89_CAPO3|nr:hypothetical protein CAOG_02382 [Capsaspora owczarzaki ATCC 30864]KJE91218.1 hypothetical protein CAOG_002382 [Capsaspora owczarzaki ATCC 30864]|eukprot:XP_004349132.2 hypothetical protein CAOG_02382 [Capsaspora owczarzaki ATCC 30864]
MDDHGRPALTAHEELMRLTQHGGMEPMYASGFAESELLAHNMYGGSADGPGSYAAHDDDDNGLSSDLQPRTPEHVHAHAGSILHGHYSDAFMSLGEPSEGFPATLHGRRIRIDDHSSGVDWNKSSSSSSSRSWEQPPSHGEHLHHHRNHREALQEQDQGGQSLGCPVSAMLSATELQQGVFIDQDGLYRLRRAQPAQIEGRFYVNGRNVSSGEYWETMKEAHPYKAQLDVDSSWAVLHTNICRLLMEHPDTIPSRRFELGYMENYQLLYNLKNRDLLQDILDRLRTLLHSHSLHMRDLVLNGSPAAFDVLQRFSLAYRQYKRALSSLVPLLRSMAAHRNGPLSESNLLMIFAQAVVDQTLIHFIFQALQVGSQGSETGVPVGQFELLSLGWLARVMARLSDAAHSPIPECWHELAHTLSVTFGTITSQLLQTCTPGCDDWPQELDFAPFFTYAPSVEDPPAPAGVHPAASGTSLPSIHGELTDLTPEHQEAALVRSLSEHAAAQHSIREISHMPAPPPPARRHMSAPQQLQEHGEGTIGQNALFWTIAAEPVDASRTEMPLGVLFAQAEQEYRSQRSAGLVHLVQPLHVNVVRTSMSPFKRAGDDMGQIDLQQAKVMRSSETSPSH